jgi:hypothetical protein
MRCNQRQYLTLRCVSFDRDVVGRDRFAACYVRVALWSYPLRGALSGTEIWRLLRDFQEIGAALFVNNRPSNHALQRTPLSRCSCNPRVPGLSLRSSCAGGWAGSLRLGR